MSQDDARSFLSRIASDPGLQQAARAEMARADQATPQRLRELASRNGLRFTEAELDAAAKELGDQSTAELSDDELDSVAGGLGTPTFSNLMSTLSNMLKKASDVSAGIVNNLK